MLLYSEIKTDKKNRSFRLNLQHTNLKVYSKRKVILSPTMFLFKKSGAEAFFFAPLHGGLTVEAALALPVFLICMIAALQYCAVMGTAVMLGTALSDTSQSMGTAAYSVRYAKEAGEGTKTAAAIVSTAYAQRQVTKKAGNPENIKNTNLLLSSVLKDGQTIDLVLTYQLRSPIQLPGIFFLQRARIRAWTGREDGAGATGSEQDESREEYVYVTVTGTVCHADPECSHLKLSIREVRESSLESLRNNSGGKYHPCEKCGDQQGSRIYITNEGNRYHTSLSCSGLKRTVRKVTKEEAGSLRMCSKCGQAAG